ncbi:hypothetical protein FACS189472_16250 [Alphaproteobacteria bacterium]|nr:hypothetical protein FACS189472_16250 [Alphaproteobacteria bacterium]
MTEPVEMTTGLVLAPLKSTLFVILFTAIATFAISGCIALVSCACIDISTQREENAKRLKARKGELLAKLVRTYVILFLKNDFIV